MRLSHKKSPARNHSCETHTVPPSAVMRCRPTDEGVCDGLDVVISHRPPWEMTECHPGFVLDVKVVILSHVTLTLG